MLYKNTENNTSKKIYKLTYEKAWIVLSSDKLI